jgi:multidrug efflux pump subunit AcrA (membrane-fusion protein)
MATGQSFQRALVHNYESLKLREQPAQEAAFQRAIRNTAEQGKAVLLEPNTTPAGENLHGLKPEDAPAPESLPIHNQTPFQQVFVPIPLSKKVAGVLHAWFAPVEPNATRARVAILAHAASEVELYLKARRISDISQELSRINTYARFLEDVAGDEDLESVSWKLVNYAREAVGCDRVCLFVDSRYGITAATPLPPSKRLAMQACSGLRRPHPRSEHAEVLKEHASELLKLAVSLTPTGESETESARPPAPPNASANGAASNGSDPEKEAAQPPQPGLALENRPKMRIILTNRDPSKTATRPDAVNHYFDTIPMNWSTVLPLYDRDNRVCGTLLFEGQQTNEKMNALFMQMRDLAVSGGRALSTALVWQRRYSLRGARKLMKWRDQLLGTSRRRLFAKYGLPGAIVIGLLAYPFPYRIRGEATLRPVNVQTVAALTSGRLMEVNAREGDRVTKGQVICVLDHAELDLQLTQALQDQERALMEATNAQRIEHNELRRRSQELSALMSGTQAEKLKRKIDLATIRAPFDGILVGPQDLAQRRGQVLREGETVAEIVDPSQWEVKVSVREQDVPNLVARVTQVRAANSSANVPGELVLTAAPNRVYHVELTDPSAFSHRLDTTGGKYSFSAVVPIDDAIVDAAKLSGEHELKMGYTGRVRFSCGRRPLAEILFGDFLRFIKLAFF